MRLRLALIAGCIFLTPVAAASDNKSFDEVREDCSRFSDMVAVLWQWVNDPLTYVDRGRPLVDSMQGASDRALAELTYLYTYQIGMAEYSEGTKQTLMDDIRQACIRGRMQ